MGPLRSDDRRNDLTARLELLPERLAAVLRGCYLEGRTAEEVAASCSLTGVELDQLRAEALTALGALPRSSRPVRRDVVSPYSR